MVGPLTFLSLQTDLGLDLSATVQQSPGHRFLDFSTSGVFSIALLHNAPVIRSHPQPDASWIYDQQRANPTLTGFCNISLHPL
mmetsp:Transcript_30630/g.70570  ORF Transcript_30630/g.70570 Transcript_30630/m.70570 type:complete len:83 (+) Transcript_30630:1040-1288(+)